jgi:hypothetical protein
MRPVAAMVATVSKHLATFLHPIRLAPFPIIFSSLSHFLTRLCLSPQVTGSRKIPAVGNNKHHRNDGKVQGLLKASLLELRLFGRKGSIYLKGSRRRSLKLHMTTGDKEQLAIRQRTTHHSLLLLHTQPGISLLINDRFLPPTSPQQEQQQ